MSCAKSPALSRLHAAHAPRQALTQACVPGQPLCGFHGVEHSSTSSGSLIAFRKNPKKEKSNPTCAEGDEIFREAI
ncbi:hypothetical protein ACFLS1_06275 [Verrucomicrobiota bacterium]